MVAEAQVVGVLGEEHRGLFCGTFLHQQVVTPEMVRFAHLREVKNRGSQIQLRGNIFTNGKPVKERRIRRENSDKDLGCRKSQRLRNQVIHRINGRVMVTQDKHHRIFKIRTSRKGIKETAQLLIGIANRITITHHGVIGLVRKALRIVMERNMGRNRIKDKKPRVIRRLAFQQFQHPINTHTVNSA